MIKYYFQGKTYDIPEEYSEKFGKMLEEHSWIVGYDFNEDISWHDSGSIASGAAIDTANFWMRRKEEIEKIIKNDYNKYKI